EKNHLSQVFDSREALLNQYKDLGLPDENTYWRKVTPEQAHTHLLEVRYSSARDRCLNTLRTNEPGSLISGRSGRASGDPVLIEALVLSAAPPSLLSQLGKWAF